MDTVIFDMDGVIVDTERLWAKAEQEIYTEATGEEVEPERFSGVSITNTYSILSEEFGAEVSEEEFFDMYEERAQEIYCEKADIMEGVKEFVETLRSKGFKVGLSTGSYWSDYVIERYDLEFDAVVDPTEISGDGKPEPETYEVALKKLESRPENALAVEDSDPGVESAKVAEVYVIGFESSEGQSLEQADEVVDNPPELRKRISEKLGVRVN